MTHPDAELARLAWEKRHGTNLEDWLRANPEEREKAKALGVWLNLIERIESEEQR